MMKRAWLLLKCLFGRKNWWATLVVILGMGVLARLGIWQLDRLEQRRAFNAALLQVLDAPPLLLNEDALPVDVSGLKNRSATVTGRFDFEQQIALKLQNWQGRPGVRLIAPLVIDGREDTAVLVDRGWIPEAEADPARWSQYEEPGVVTVEGYIAPSQTLPGGRTAEPTPVEPQSEWFRVEIEAIQQQMPYQLLPFYVVQTPAGEGDVQLPIRSALEVDLSEGPHMGYAIQWFLFSLTLAVVYVLYVYKHDVKGAAQAAAQAAAQIAEE